MRMGGPLEHKDTKELSRPSYKSYHIVTNTEVITELIVLVIILSNIIKL